MIRRTLELWAAAWFHGGAARLPLRILPKEASMRRWLLTLSLLLPLLALASTASAAWFLDGYVGASLTHKGEFTFEAFGAELERDAEYRSSAVFGVRFGTWLDGLPWLGVAVDASYFRPSADIQVFPITALVMARYGFFPDEEFKEGRLHVYGGVGGGLFISNLDGFLGRFEGSGTSVDMGLDTRLGVSYRVESNWAVFGEYRFTHVSPSFSIDVFGGRSTADTTFNTSHFLLGLSYRF
jgi:opacity protein-like surface antigen